MKTVAWKPKPWSQTRTNLQGCQHQVEESAVVGRKLVGQRSLRLQPTQRRVGCNIKQRNMPLHGGNGKYVGRRNMPLCRDDGKYVGWRKMECGKAEEYPAVRRPQEIRPRTRALEEMKTMAQENHAEWATRVQFVSIEFERTLNFLANLFALKFQFKLKFGFNMRLTESRSNLFKLPSHSANFKFQG
jgi:hypothetical protein